MQPLFSSPISTAQLSTHPGLNGGAELALVHTGGSLSPPPLQSPCGAAPSLEAVTPRGTPGLSPHSSPGPLDPFPPPWPSPFVSLISRCSGPSRECPHPRDSRPGFVQGLTNQPRLQTGWRVLRTNHPVLEVCVWCCPFPDVTLAVSMEGSMEWVGDITP